MNHFEGGRLVAAVTLIVCLLVADYGVAAAAGQKKTAAQPATGKAAAAGKAAKPKTYTVTMDVTTFRPEALTLKAGDKVVWVNKDFFPHTATSKAAAFDSGSVATGGSWSHTFTKSGKYPYICTFHPTMKGTIRVK
jgi:plastocyanin